MTLGVTSTPFPNQSSLIAGSKDLLTRAYAIAKDSGIVKEGTLLIQTGGATTPPSVFGAPLPLVVRYNGGAITTNDTVFVAECEYDTTGWHESHVRQGGYVQGSFNASKLIGYGDNIRSELLNQGIDAVYTVPVESGRAPIPANAPVI